MSMTHEEVFGELRSVTSGHQSAVQWKALLELVSQSFALDPERHAHEVEPYLLGALRPWPLELRRARLLEDPAHVVALAQALVVECDDHWPTPEAVAAHLASKLDDAARARITHLDLVSCVHRPLAVLETLAASLRSITNVYVNVYYDDDHRRARRRETLSTLDSTHVVGAIVEAWGPGLEGLGLSCFGMNSEGDSANDCSWKRVLREIENLPKLRALELSLDERDTKRWEQELLADPRFDRIEEVTIELSDHVMLASCLTERPASRHLERVKITNCPATVARTLIECEHLSNVRRWELLPSLYVRAPVGWSSRLGAYWAASSAHCPETFDAFFSVRWLNLLDLDRAKVHDVLFGQDKKTRSSERVEGLSLRHISPRDVKRFLRSVTDSVPNLKHLHAHKDYVMRPIDVRAMNAPGFLERLESLNWSYTHSTSQQNMAYAAGGFAEARRAEWYELVADESLHPALRQRAWRSIQVELQYKSSFIALAKAMGLKRLSSKNISQLREAIDLAAPPIVHAPLLLAAETPPELLETLSPW